MEAARQILGITRECSVQDRMQDDNQSVGRMKCKDPEGDGTGNRPVSAEQSMNQLPGCSTPLTGYSAPMGHHHNSLCRDKQNIGIFSRNPNQCISK